MLSSFLQVGLLDIVLSEYPENYHCLVQILFDLFLRSLPFWTLRDYLYHVSFGWSHDHSKSRSPRVFKCSVIEQMF